MARIPRNYGCLQQGNDRQQQNKAYPILTQSLANFESIELDINALVGILKGAMESNKKPNPKIYT